MPNAEKVGKVAVLKGRIEGSQALLLTEYRGLTVHDVTELRRSLADAAGFSVVKNTLMLRAATEAGIAELERLLEGPTAVAFVSGDPVTAAKRVVEASKKLPALILKGAYMEGRVLSAEEAQSLATLDSREVMLSKIAGILKSEMSRAAAMFQALQGKFLGLLEAYKEKVPPGEAPPAEVAPVPVPAAEPGAPSDSAPLAAEASDEAPAEDATDGGAGPDSAPDSAAAETETETETETDEGEE